MQIGRASPNSRQLIANAPISILAQICNCVYQSYGSIITKIPPTTLAYFQQCDHTPGDPFGVGLLAEPVLELDSQNRKKCATASVLLIDHQVLETCYCRNSSMITPEISDCFGWFKPRKVIEIVAKLVATEISIPDKTDREVPPKHLVHVFGRPRSTPRQGFDPHHECKDRSLLSTILSPNSQLP